MGCKNQPPITDEAVVDAPHVAHLEGPGAVQGGADQVGKRLHALVGAAGQCASGSVRRPGSVVGRGAPAVIPTRALYVRCGVIVHRNAQVGTAASLLVQDHGLPGGTDQADDQVAHEGMLHVHAYASQVVGVGERLSRCELGESERSGKALPHIVRQEYAPPKVTVRQLVPGRGVHCTGQAKGFCATSACTGDAIEVGYSAHQGLQVHQVGAGASVVVQQVQLCGVGSGLGVRVVHACARIVHDRPVAKIPFAAGDAETRRRVRPAAVEIHCFADADLLRHATAESGHGHRAVTRLIAGDGGRKNTCARIVGPEHDGEAPRRVGCRCGNNLPLQPRTGPVSEQWRGGAVAVIDGHVVHGSHTRSAQVEGDEA